MLRTGAATARSPAISPSQSSVEADLVRLAAADRNGLVRRWRFLFGRPAPDLPNTLLRRILAYRVQADAAGDLDPATIKLLGRFAAGDLDTIPLPAARTKPGTLLVREWEGTLQRVMALEDGFAWNGQTYDSLSAVARAITGANWNGPRFFGLRNKATQAKGRKRDEHEPDAVAAQSPTRRSKKRSAAQRRSGVQGADVSIAGSPR